MQEEWYAYMILETDSKKRRPAWTRKKTSNAMTSHSTQWVAGLPPRCPEVRAAHR